MSERFLTILALVAVAGAVIFVMRDRIPSPNVSRDRPFVASNKHRVLPALEGGTAFEVLSRPGAAGPQYFCAAAEFALKVLRADMADTLVTVSAEAPSQAMPKHKSVWFELRSADADPVHKSGAVIDLSNSGQSRTLSLALQFCN